MRVFRGRDRAAVQLVRRDAVWARRWLQAMCRLRMRVGSRAFCRTCWAPSILPWLWGRGALQRPGTAKVAWWLDNFLSVSL